MAVLTMKVDKALDKALTERAAKGGRSKSYYMREGLLQYLEDLDYVEAVDRAYEKWEQNRFKTCPWEKVRAQLGLNA